jgi:hypothetical protein
MLFVAVGDLSSAYPLDRSRPGPGLGGVGAIVQPKELFLVAAVPLFAVTVLMRSSGNYRAASEAGRSANGLSDDQEQT